MASKSILGEVMSGLSEIMFSNRLLGEVISFFGRVNVIEIAFWVM